MMKDCLQFLIEPAKKLKSRLKDSQKRVKLETTAPLMESQLFMMELTRDLNKICQGSSVLSHIWTSEDLWPAGTCRDFIVDWSAVLEKIVQPRIGPMEPQHERPEKRDWKGHLLHMLEAAGECDMLPHKRVIMEWTREIKSRSKPTIWPGEHVLMMLADLEFQWKRGCLPDLLPAVELIMLAILNANNPVKEDVTKLWLVRRQRLTRTDAIRYIPHSVWNWIREAAEEVSLDSDTANPDLLISNEKRMRCGLERQDVPVCPRRFSGWLCTLGQQGFTSGRHYWEVEVGDRDWRLGVAKASAVRQGFRSLNTDTGYLTLRLERGTDLKALTVPATLLPQSLVPQKVGVYLDYEQGQLSFYDVDKRRHLYTYNETFREELYPVFGTVEVVRDLVIRSVSVRQPCLCPRPCLWN
ncbi:E3 ubiquitin-protein ligase TRIM21 isoform X2 [Thalassophryne amazonica]|uniref:E3 ubiquitin-protein ligase TRIM21 isoform X1 n=1 Tax=Thalassophryne amazonica TaxID=390379 RepID=UPI0014708B22|nr:E3 ubiquitin-protein ligase TRIM21 isoform X1 [Thalassophryne amazonica]XP_034050308.1 E3 ubiquitin-protein ligase TRIM21 isoform X2 [Thalassophryne amazonica]